jgi:hypothetical protein
MTNQEIDIIRKFLELRRQHEIDGLWCDGGLVRVFIDGVEMRSGPAGYAKLLMAVQQRIARRAQKAAA